jgi:hypothetical protein
MSEERVDHGRTDSRHNVFVAGIGLWGPRLPGWSVARSVIRGEAEPPDALAQRPAPAMLPPTERRRAPDTVSVALEVAVQAIGMSGVDPKSCASVFSSAYGDLAINDYLCQTLRDAPTLTSPTRFHNSVHNAAAGYWSIGTESMQPYTAVAAYTESFAAGLLESLVQAAAGEVPVLYVAYDVEARGPLATQNRSRSLLGLALLVTPERSAQAVAKLEWRLRAEDVPPATRPSTRVAGLAGENPMTSGLPLFEALAADSPRQVIVATNGGPALELRVGPCRMESA